jgi:hypothetical protein
MLITFISKIEFIVHLQQVQHYFITIMIITIIMIIMIIATTIIDAGVPSTPFSFVAKYVLFPFLISTEKCILISYLISQVLSIPII